MNQLFSHLTVIELSSVLAGPSVGLFFAELGAKVIKIENAKTGGDVTRSWKAPTESKDDSTSAYYWSVNAGKEAILLDFKNDSDLQKVYSLVKDADIVIANFKQGDDKKLKVDYDTFIKINPSLIYASINGFGHHSPRTAYDLILQAESGFMFMNGEENAPPLKMPVALIDLLAGHQLKEAILIALIKKHQTQQGAHISVSLFDSAVASLANQATNWLIANHLPVAQGSLHPNIAPYGELFLTQDEHYITFAIGSNEQFKKLCVVLNISLFEEPNFATNQERVKNRDSLFELLNERISKLSYDEIFGQCLQNDIPIGKIRNLKEVFELPEAQAMLKHFNYSNKEYNTVSSIAFKFL